MSESAKIGDVVWFRMARMHGNPPQHPMRALIIKTRAGGHVDLEIGCEGTSAVSGAANMVPHKDDVPLSLQTQAACWWHGDLSELRTDVQQEAQP